MTIASAQTENQAATAETKTEAQNFAQIRKALEAANAAREAAEAKARALEEQAARKTRTSDLEDEEDDSDEPYLDKRRFKKEMGKTVSQLQNQTKEEIQRSVHQAIAEERRNSYLKQNSDFNEIMQPEMMQKLVERDPNLAETILEMPEGFARQKLVYHAIKAMNLHKKEEPKPSIQDKINANRKSPYYQPSGVGTAPYAGAGDFSPTGQKSAFDKMQELKNRLRLG